MSPFLGMVFPINLIKLIYKLILIPVLEQYFNLIKSAHNTGPEKVYSLVYRKHVARKVQNAAL